MRVLILVLLLAGCVTSPFQNGTKMANGVVYLDDDGEDTVASCEKLGTIVGRSSVGIYGNTNQHVARSDALDQASRVNATHYLDRTDWLRGVVSGDAYRCASLDASASAGVKTSN